jgi:hypothetical protein
MGGPVVTISKGRGRWEKCMRGRKGKAGEWISEV